MNNYIQPGKVVTLTAPHDCSSGQGALVGSLFGVATADVANGADGEFETEGVFELPKPTGQAFSQGEKCYWDTDGRNVTESDSSESHLIGVAIEAAGSSATTVKVRLNGVSVS